MKRYLYILFIAALAVACAREEMTPETESPVGNIPEGLTVPVVMHFDEPITLYADTKASADMEWGVDPRISSIHVAVFGWSGYLQDYLTAEPCDASGNPVSGYASKDAGEDASTHYFMVRLPVNTDGRRTCHIIANGPDNVEFAYDTDLMKELSTTEGNGGYWQWVYLQNGILPERDPDGEFKTDAAGNLKPSQDVKDAFSNIKLIRNFASVTITVDESCKNFQILGWTICKMPVEGTFAPFSSAWEANNEIDGRGYGWLGDYTTDWIYNTASAKVSRSSPAITYEGFPTEPVIETKIPQNESAFNAAGVAVASGATKFVYERAVTSETNPFLLIAAKYVDEDPDPGHNYASELGAAPTYYYRMDISKDGEYVPFYRNYSYKITISGASVQGYNSPAIAAKHNSSDSFSLSLDTATLSDVSDGLTRLTTDRAAYSFTYDSSDATKSFGYDFEKLDPPTPTHLNSNANVTVSVTGDAIAATPALSWGVDPVDPNKGKITYTLVEPEGDEVLTSSIKIMGVIKDGSGNVISRLVRTVTVVVFNKMHVDPKFVPQIVSQAKGEETTLIIPLYKDLPWTLFPMQINIEDTNKTLNPAAGENLPVQVGPLMDGEKSTFYYVYTLNYSDYEEMNADAKASGKADVEISIPMVTILENNATSARIWNDYFALVDYSPDPAGAPKAELLNDTANIITPNTATIDASTTSYTFTVKSTGNWILTVGREHGAAATNVTVTPSTGVSTGSSSQSVTVHIPKNTSLVERKYIITLTNTDKTEDRTRTAELVQGAAIPEVKPSASVTSIKGNDTSGIYTIDVEANCDWEAEILDEFAEFYSDPFGSGNGEVQIKMTAKNYSTSGRTVRIKFTIKNNGGVVNYNEITQRGLSTSDTFESNSGEASDGVPLSISNTSNGCTISFSSSDNAAYSATAGLYGHYSVKTGSFTASGSGTDFCSFKELRLNTHYVALSLAQHHNISSMTKNQDAGSFNYNNDHSEWLMANTITSSNQVTDITLTPTSSNWHVLSLQASYYYWN